MTSELTLLEGGDCTEEDRGDLVWRYECFIKIQLKTEVQFNDYVD